MQIELSPAVKAVLEAQVAAGLYGTIEEALTGAVLGLPPERSDDLTWAKPYLDEADEDIENGRTFPHDTVFAELRRELGKG